MVNNGQITPEVLQIQGLLDRYLQTNSLNEGFDEESIHLDEDSLSAFIDGNLLEREAKPIVNHLSNCSYCRHISAELVRLDMTFANEPAAVVMPQGEPTRVSEVLNSVLSKIFGTADGAVFAHSEKDEENPEREKDNETK